MKLAQNDRLNQVKADILVVGVDIGTQEHFARAFDWMVLRSVKESLCRNTRSFCVQGTNYEAIRKDVKLDTGMASEVFS